MTYPTYKKAGFFFTPLLMLSLILVSCGNSNSTKAKDSKEEPKEEAKKDPNGIIELNAKQMEAVGVTIGPIEQKNLTDVVKANGQLAVPPQNMANVSILSGGIIRNIKVVEGQQVNKGQVLATIENQELVKIQQDYLSAKNNFTYVSAEYERQTKLQEAGAGTGKSFQASQATYNAEKARIQAFETQLKQLGIAANRISGGNIVSSFPLISPISGTVGTIKATTGSYVQPGTAVMEVVDNSKIHCDLIVFEKDLIKVRPGQQVNFELTNQNNQRIKGRISGINKSFENESKGVIVHAIIEDSARQNLIPGMYVTALISVGTQKVPAVPIEAVISSEGKQFIYIVVNGKAGEQGNDVVHFKKVEVSTGVSELGFINIKHLSALPAGTKIATKGAFYLQSKEAGSSEEE